MAGRHRVAGSDRPPAAASAERGTETAMFHADLHIHSKFSRACSRDCGIPHLAAGALRKGISVLGTGDFTHPAWADELKSSLVPAEAGLLRLRPDLERDLRRHVPPACEQPVRFMLSVEISTIYRRDERTRKVHHLIYAPTFEAADRITASLAKIGNLASDGRPILGLDPRHLLEITLEGGPGCYLVPAHIWTPWFAVLGSRSGSDAVAACYGDLAGEIFAVETGLSSDPRMNWMCSSLDAYRLVSNSDAHSPPMLGREATAFTTAMDFFSIAEALRTGDGLGGTIEFYPEEGKYHLDGHRKCGIRFEPEQTRDRDGACPQCHKPLTVGVLHRVAELADRPDGYRPEKAAGFNNLVPLAEIISEILCVGPRSKSVNAVIDRLVAAFGPELGILQQVPAGDLARIGGTALTEAISRLRRGEVIKDAAGTTSSASGRGLRRGRGPQVQQHPGVPQGVRLYPVKAKELGDAFVVGPQQLRVDVGRDRRAEYLPEAQAAEELDRERQHEYPLHPQLARPVEQDMSDPAPDTVALAVPANRDGPDLGQVLPQHVQGPAADNEPVGLLLGHPEFLDVLVQHDGCLAEQAPGPHVRVDQAADPRDVGGTRLPDRISHGGSTLAGTAVPPAVLAS